ncbi:MAG: hypothetical protein HY754_10755 [Nitrospirae bacterium]|nr:hypothetical protein [Nitrospirota bacterium]
MLFNRKQTIFMLLPFIAIIFSTLVFFYIEFKPSLSSMEQELSRFSYKKIAVIRKQPVTVTHSESPMELSARVQKDFPLIPLSEIFPQETKKEKKVLLILISDNRKMAIINDIVVREGDKIDHGMVKKIEKNRVLIKEKEGEEWIGIRCTELQR